MKFVEANSIEFDIVFEGYRKQTNKQTMVLMLIDRLIHAHIILSVSTKLRAWQTGSELDLLLFFIHDDFSNFKTNCTAKRTLTHICFKTFNAVY